MADDQWQIIQAPDGPVRFPKSMSDDQIAEVMKKEYPPVSENMDVLKSAGQGAREVGERILSAPGDMDQVEHTILNWLKTSAGDAPILQGTGMEGVPKRFAENWEAVSKKLFPDVTLPNNEEVKWTEKQLGVPDPYQPQTDAGNIARYGTEGIAGAAMGGPVISSFGRFAASHLPGYAQRIIGGGLAGAGWAAGNEAFKAGSGNRGWAPYR